MESPIQDDPYEALGVAKIANAGDIKTAYRKLVLKCHPDKVTDPLLKQQKADEFHKIQQAYEILNDDEKRNRYDARVRLAELKAEMMQRETTRGGSSSKGSVFERPPRPSYPSFSRSSTAQYEVRTPRFTEDYHEEPRSTRRHSPHAAYTRRPEAQTAKAERERKAEKEDKARSERRRARESDVRESRDRKYYSSTEDIHRAEEDRKKRDDVVRKNEEARKAEEARRAAAKSNMYETPSAYRSSYDKQFSMEENARRYQATSAGQSYSTLRPERPEPVRSSSHQYAEARRSRVRGGETRHRSPEIVEERVPGFSKSATTPEKLREMTGDRAMPPRSYSHNVAEAREYAVPPAPMRRADSMPMPTSTSPPHISTSSSRRKEDSRSSKLRHGENVQLDSGYSSSSPVTPDETDAYPSTQQQPNIHVIPPPVVPPVSIPRTTTYHYPSNGVTGERLTVSPDKYTSSPYKTEVRAPPTERESHKDRERRRAHDPTSSRDRDRPPMASVRTVPAPSGSHHVREPVRAPSYSHRSPDAERERDRVREKERERERDSRRGERSREMGYAEIPSEYTKRHNMQPRSYEKEQVNIGKKYGVDDINFSGRSRGHDDPYMRSGRERDRVYDERERYDRPTVSRSSTFIY